MAYKNIQFFDKDGINLTPQLNTDGVFEFTVQIEKTSTGLFSSQHIFMLEEILLEQKNNILNNKTFTQNTQLPRLVKMLYFLSEYGDVAPAVSLKDFFSFNELTDEYYFNNFINKNSKYILKVFYGESDYYTITEEGRVYLDFYKNSEEFLNSNAYNLEKAYTRPVAECNPEYGEDVYLLFNWRQSEKEYDANMFLFFLDLTDKTLYKENTLFESEDGKMLPALVPAYSANLIPSAENPYWKMWSVPYRFDFVKHFNGKSSGMFYGNNVLSHRVFNSEQPINSTPFQLNIALTSNTAGIYDRVLEVNICHEYKKYNADGTLEGPGYIVSRLANITFFGEVVAEELRFKNLLDNFGREVKESDCFVFRDSDVFEHLPNYIDLNNKRKELLLSGDEIFPFVGSYKGFVNALKFFGYSDLRLKEYFLNIKMSDPQNGKLYYSGVDIPLDLKLPEDSETHWNDFIFGRNLDNKILKKTSRFGLYYDINRTTGKFDDLGFPIVEDAFQFTNEEVLIKLFGLKKVLEERFLPHHVRIIDITGEGVYFAKFKIDTWQDLSQFFKISPNNPPQFDIYPKKGYIKSLQELLNIFKRRLDSETQKVFTLSGTTILKNILDNTLRDFLQNDSATFDFDKELPESKFFEMFDDYYELFDNILDNIRNTFCSDYFNSVVRKDATWNELQKFKADVFNKFKSQIRLYGLPVLIKLLPYKITWDDLTLPWDELGPIKRADSQESKGESYFCWDSMGFYNGQFVEWFVEHEHHLYCKHIKGKINSKSKYLKYPKETRDAEKDRTEVVVFLPKPGFYNVSCTVQDFTNFPNMAGKKKCIEALVKNPDIIAFGQNKNEGANWDSLTASWDSLSKSWSELSTHNIPTSWDDCRLSWDDLCYDNYLEQTLVKNVSTSKIIDYDEETNMIILKGRDFFDNYETNKDVQFKNTFAIERPSEIAPIATDIGVISTLKDKLILDGDIKIPFGEKVELYLKAEINSKAFSIKDKNILRISKKFYSAIIPTNFITIFDSVFNKKYNVNIVSQVNNFIDGFVDITTDMDLDSTFFDTVVIRTCNCKFKVLSCIYDRLTDKTTVNILDKNSTISNFNTIVLNEYCDKDTKLLDEQFKVLCEYGGFSGYYVFEVDNVSLVNNNSTIYTVHSKDICLVTTSFEAQFTKYDINHARINSNLIQKGFDNITSSWDSLSTESLDMDKYKSNYINGFKIDDISGVGFLSINNETENWNFNLIVDNEHVYFDRPELLNLLISQLKQSDLDSFKVFDYYLHDQDSIVAVMKSLSSSKNLDINYDSKTNLEILYYKDASKSGNTPSFSLNNMFIKYTDFAAKQNTKCVFKLGTDNFFLDLTDKRIIWQLVNETTDKLLIETENDYLIWSFVDIGVYSVRVQIFEKQKLIIDYNKKSWINIY